MIRKPIVLFLYFLRSSAALASEPAKTGIFKGSQQQQIIPNSLSRIEYMGGYISLRVARRTDVPSIQRCNLATLPENYNENFYATHMRNWPELALVAEHIPEGYVEEGNNKNNRRSILGGLTGGAARNKVSPLRRCDDSANKQCQIIGYVLGKVDQIPRKAQSESFAPSWVQDDDNGFLARQNQKKSFYYEQMGHVTSLAILDGYRRKGLAAHLMNQLHYEMKNCYNADAVGLHVRVSNEAATNLYVSSMGYKVDDVIPGYYQDGEDAYLMRKDFVSDESDVHQPRSMQQDLEEYQDIFDADEYDGSATRIKRFRFPSFHSAQYNKTKKDMLLPRTIFNFDSDTILDTKATEVGSRSIGSEKGRVSAVSATASIQ